MCVDSQGTIWVETSDVGLQRSTDEGTSWSRCYGGPIVSITADDSGNLLAGFDNAFLQIVNNGNDYVVLSDPAKGKVRALAFSNSPSPILYAGVASDDTSSSGSLWWSSDAGHAWTEVHMPSRTAVHSIAAGALGALYIGTYSGVYSLQSPTGNATLIRVDTFSYSPSCVFVNKAGYVISNGHGMIFRSTDGGNHWQDTVMLSDTVCSIAESPNGALMATAMHGNVYLSHDSGRSWLASPSHLGNAALLCCMFSKRGVAFAGSDGQSLWRSEDEGKTWFNIDFGETPAQFTVTPSGTAYAVRMDNSIYSLSSDHTLWSYFAIGSSVVALPAWGDSAIIYVDSCLYAARAASGTQAFHCSPGDYKCDHTGGEASTTIYPPDDLYIMRIARPTSSSIWATGVMSGPFWYHADGQVHTSRLGEPDVYKFDIRNLNSRPTVYPPQYCERPEGVWAGTGATVVYEEDIQCNCAISTDTGATWKFFPDSCHTSFAITSAERVYEVNSGGRVIWTRDAGAHWTVALDLGASGNQATTLILGPHDVIIVGTASGTLYQSRDGLTWTSFGNDLPGGASDPLGVDSSGGVYLFVKDRGIYYINSVVSVASSKRDGPLEPQSLAVFPNPLTSGQTLSISLDHPSLLSIEVDDMLGHRFVVCRNVNALSGTTSFDLSTVPALPSGMYGCRIQDGNHVVWKPLAIFR